MTSYSIIRNQSELSKSKASITSFRRSVKEVQAKMKESDNPGVAKDHENYMNEILQMVENLESE